VTVEWTPAKADFDARMERVDRDTRLASLSADKNEATTVESKHDVDFVKYQMPIIPVAKTGY
jgi:hypothetical protein